jgi:hypothetical protein
MESGAVVTEFDVRGLSRKITEYSECPTAVRPTEHPTEEAPVIVDRSDGQLLFKNLKLFPGCANDDRAVSELAGILDNRTGRALANTQFQITTHGFLELKDDTGVTITFKRIEPGENPFDYAFASCNNVSALSGGSYHISIVDGKP